MTEPITDEYLLPLAAERRPHNPQEFERCTCSPHPWHGLKCRFLGDHCECAASVRAS